MSNNKETAISPDPRTKSPSVVEIKNADTQTHTNPTAKIIKLFNISVLIKFV